MKSLGKSWLIELFDCDSEIINDMDEMENILLESVKISGATIIKSVFHKFNPHGVSGVVVIAESHFSVHTWPEYAYCAVDIFTCGDDINAEKAAKFLSEKLYAKTISVIDIKRGILNLPVEKVRHK